MAGITHSADIEAEADEYSVKYNQCNKDCQIYATQENNSAECRKACHDDHCFVPCNSVPGKKGLCRTYCL
jgi:hypothetical protein